MKEKSVKEYKSKKIKWIYLILILDVSISVLSMYAWAKYMSKVTGNASAAIAHFSFNVSERSSGDLTIDLAGTRLHGDTTSIADTTVAPGTKGALAFDINADISDVSIEYNIDIDLTNVPQNLIFYSDEGMKNAIYNSENKINIKGFFSASTQNKTDTKTVYWAWPLETGQTQAEIDKNDITDSESMGDNITIDIHVTGAQAKENPLAKQYAVTFDANGGVITGYGNSEKVTKSITSGTQYGNLLEPKKDGYEFVGWSKNLALPVSQENYYVYNFKQETGDSRTSSEIMHDGNFGGLTNQSYFRINGNSGETEIDTMWYIYSKEKFFVSAGEEYVFSFYIRSENAKRVQYLDRTTATSGSAGHYYIQWNDGNRTYMQNNALFDNDGNWHLITNKITVPDGVTSAAIYIGTDSPNLYGEGSYVDIANIQFSKESSTTPYYIEADTEFNSQANTTLYANWREAQ